MKRRGELLFLGLILLAAFILRLNALDVKEYTGDEAVYFIRAYNLFNLHHISFLDHPPLFFYLLALVYKVFGVTWLTSRLLSVVAGLTTLAFIYLLVKYLFDLKTALFSAVLYAFSFYDFFYHRQCILDPLMTFFWFGSVYFLVRGFEDSRFLLLCGVFTGWGLLTKHTSILLPLVIASILFIELKFGRKKITLKYVIVAADIVVLSVIPLITYNLLLYKHEGHLDLEFTNLFNIETTEYDELTAYDPTPNLSALPGNLIGVVRVFWSYHTPLFMLVAALGLLLLLRMPQKRVLLPFMLAPLLVYCIGGETHAGDIIDSVLRGQAPAEWHFVPVSPFLSIFSGISFSHLYSKMKNKHLIGILLAATLAGEFILILGEYQHPTSPLMKLRDYVERNVGEKDLIVYDSFTWYGHLATMLYNKNHLKIDRTKYIPYTPKGWRTLTVYTILSTRDAGPYRHKEFKDSSMVKADGILVAKDNSNKVFEAKNEGGKTIFVVYKSTIPVTKEQPILNKFFSYYVGWPPKEKVKGVYPREPTYKLAYAINLLFLISLFLLPLILLVLHKDVIMGYKE